MLESFVIKLGRNLQVKGIGRFISILYPTSFQTNRYVKGVFQRNDTLKMELDSRNHIDWNLIFCGDFEPHLSGFFRRVISKGNVVIDVGANIGVHTLTFASQVGSDGYVLAFEPNPLVRKQLEKNCALNEIENVRLYNCALGDDKGVLLLRVPSAESAEYSNMGLASLVALDTPHDLVEVEVQLLDDVVNNLGLERVDMVKIDVQGYEYQVLAGAKQILESLSPTIVFEWEPWAWEKAGSQLEDVIEFLESMEYRIYQFSKKNDSISLVEDVAAVGSGNELLALKDKNLQTFLFPICQENEI